MDAFFAAVEERNSPQFKGLPIVVGADPKGGLGRGVVSTANYKAREYGIRSALPITRAWRFSEEARKAGKPAAVFLPGDFRQYSKISKSIFGIVQTNAPVVEQASVDEAYFDLSFCGSFPKAERLCRKIKKEILKKERLTCSIGLGPNKLIAKIASDKQKPDGLTVVRPEQAEAFLEPLAIRKIPGIGPKTEAVLKRKGVALVSDLKKRSELELYEWFGQWGLEFYERIRGWDNSSLVREYEAKSVGEQETLDEDTRSFALVFGRLEEMCRNILGYMKVDGFENFRTVVITVRFADFQTQSTAHTLPEPADSFAVLKTEATKLLMPYFDRRKNPGGKAIRLVGVRLEKLN